MGSFLENLWSRYSPGNPLENVAAQAITAETEYFSEGPLGPDGIPIMAVAMARETIRLSREIFPGPFSIDQFLTVRKENIAFFYNLFHGMLYGRKYGPNFHDKMYLPKWVLEHSGIVSRQETELIMEYLDDRQNQSLRTKNDTGRLAEELLMPHVSDRNPNAKILGLDQAATTIEKARLEGYRTVGVFGGFDYGTAGHTKFLQEAALVAGKHGKIFAFVNSDAEIAFTRGPNRPYYFQETRLQNIASNSGVDRVFPLGWEGDSQASEIAYYQELQQSLALQFRFIGEKDYRFELFHQACDSAGTILVFSDSPRLDHATTAIAAIQENI